MDWGGVDYLWIIVMFLSDVFGLSFWRHPFTAEDSLLSKWCNATFLQIFKWYDSGLFNLCQLAAIQNADALSTGKHHSLSSENVKMLCCFLLTSDYSWIGRNRLSGSQHILQHLFGNYDSLPFCTPLLEHSQCWQTDNSTVWFTLQFPSKCPCIKHSL